MKHKNSEFIKAWLNDEVVYYQPLNSKNWVPVAYLTTFDQTGLRFSFSADYEDPIECIMGNFDFEKVRMVMECLEWSYFDTNGIPTIPKLKDTALRMLKTCKNGLLNNPGEDKYCAGTGGFEATAYRKDRGFFDYELKFVCASFEGFADES